MTQRRYNYHTVLAMTANFTIFAGFKSVFFTGWILLHNNIFMLFMTDIKIGSIGDIVLGQALGGTFGFCSNRFKRSAIFKCSVAKLFKALRQHYRFHTSATLKCSVSDILQALVKLDLFKRLTSLERAVTYIFNTFGSGYLADLFAIFKGTHIYVL